MGVALITWGRFSTPTGNVTVPAPSTDGVHVPWLWDFLASQAHELRRVGFTALQLPPDSKAQGGAGAGCDGYGVFDPRDIGSKEQQGSIPTRYGTAESLRRLVAVAHANDMQIYLDMVLHQRIGANAGAATYRYLGSDGKTLSGRGAMDPGCFRGQVATVNGRRITIAEDDVPNVFWDISFGDEVSYQHCQPAGQTIDDAIDMATWKLTTLGADGMRIDDVKGLWPDFVAKFLNSGAMAGKVAYGEFFDNASAALGWALSKPMGGRCMVEDFQLKFSIQDACNNSDASSMQNGGIAAINGPMAVTFVDNPDTDTSAGEQTIGNKLLGYAALLTGPGYPFVYGKDYFGPDVWPGAYGLKSHIDNLVGIHENLAFGDQLLRYVDGKAIVRERTGAPGLLTALNFDNWNARTVTVQTTFGANAELHDYAGHHADIWTDGQGRATFTIPSNAYDRGQSFLCFSRPGYWTAPKPPQRAITQVFHGASDLDIGPARNGTVEIARIYCAVGTSISITAHIDAVAWSDPDASVEVYVAEGGASAVVSGQTLFKDLPSVVSHRPVEKAGWHTIFVDGYRLPDGGAPFSILIKYTSPQVLSE